MKRVLCIGIIFILFLCGCNPKSTVSTITPTINKTELHLAVGDTERLIVSGKEEVEWNISNPEIARVFYGAVTALKSGETIVTAKTENQTFECKVYVTANENASQTVSVQSSAQNSSLETPSAENGFSLVTSVNEDQEQQTQSQMTHEEAVAASERAAFELVERLTDEKYDKAIADLKNECNEIIDGYKSEIEQKQARLEIVGEECAEGFILKDRVFVLKNEISNTEKIRDKGIEALERQRAEEHKRNEEEYKPDNQ